MEKVNIATLKNQLSRFVRRVRNGAHYIVTDHGTPVAQLLPLGEDIVDSLPEQMEHHVAGRRLGHYCLKPRFSKGRPINVGDNIASRLIREDRDTRP